MNQYTPPPLSTTIPSSHTNTQSRCCRALRPTHGISVPQPRAIGTGCTVSRQGDSHLTLLCPVKPAGLKVMADKQDGSVVMCSVCKTHYPRCKTCESYGRKGNHKLDRDKTLNSHDNPSYIADNGTQQPTWNRKETK